MTKEQRALIWEMVFRQHVSNVESATDAALISAINKANAQVARIDALFENDIRGAR